MTRAARVAGWSGGVLLAVLWCGGGGRAGTARAQEAADAAPATAASIPEMDSRFVRQEVPRKVRAGQVFTAKITMKNAGRLAWKEVWRQVGTNTQLISQSSPDSATWGTSYIIQGQGTQVAPGAEFTFVSALKAPAEAGKYDFQWRLKGRGEMFGEPTERVEIVVEPIGAPPAEPELPGPDEDGRRVLTLDDFAYVGSFKIPAKAGEGGAGYSELGMALRTGPDGRRTLLLNYTHPGQSLAEVDIPEPVKLTGESDLKELKTAPIYKVWGRLRIEVPKVGDVTGISPNAGLWWDEKAQTLYWSWYHWYWTGGALPVLAASKLGDDGTITYAGPWTAPNQKHHWGGVIGLPAGFARKYAGGRPMALGFGGYYNVCGPCSRGPALGAIARPDPSAKEVDLLALVGYSQQAKAPRDGDYFSANCGYWNDPPEAPWRGSWAAFDECRAGVFIELPDKHGCVFFAHLATGRIGYDYGAGTTGGRAEYWYFYDPRDLGAAAGGKSKPGEVMPYRMAKDGPRPGGPAVVGGMATGCCFDAEQRRLYVIRTWAYRQGTEYHPLVHVYRVTDGGS